ncbi:hypothetical protein [Tychonema sp. BBK16]|uniref:hypothetical protein n=1 Tax=Tychonema sp. BBK16 TaxID=2699888 RepID=UPI001F18E2C3|nr:hypothetical protein [Tychonema sp. BBK16]MCF6371959.1 hypothetical protein [Tychonema sp. BBK16]
MATLNNRTKSKKPGRIWRPGVGLLFDFLLVHIMNFPFEIVKGFEYFILRNHRSPPGIPRSPILRSCQLAAELPSVFSNNFSKAKPNNC